LHGIEQAAYGLQGSAGMKMPIHAHVWMVLGTFASKVDDTHLPAEQTKTELQRTDTKNFVHLQLNHNHVNTVIIYRKYSSTTTANRSNQIHSDQVEWP